MINALFAALLLAGPAAAAPVCRTDPMRAEWQTKNFGLWLTDYTIPESSPRTATLHYVGCEVVTSMYGEPIEPREERKFLSEDGTIGIIASTDDSDPAATWLTLVTGSPERGVYNSAQLGAFSHHRVYFKGVGVDQVKFHDNRGRGADLVKNIILIPE
jgi:hypothetical protein